MRCNKIAHSCKDYAMIALKKTAKAKNVHVSGFCVYQCSKCHQWHVSRDRSNSYSDEADRIMLILNDHEKKLKEKKLPL